ncbi:Transformer-2 like protein beta, partial [Nosema granulosis]
KEAPKEEGWGAPVESTSTGGWGESTSVPTSKPETSTGGWGAPVESTSTGGWGAPEIQSSVPSTNPETSTGGWGAPETSTSAGGWGADEFATETNTTTSSYSRPDYNNQTSSRGYESSYQQSSSSFRGRDTRRNDSYGQQSYQPEQRSRGFEDRPPRQFDNDRRYGSSDRGRPAPGRSDSYREEYPPRDGGYSRKRYDSSEGYNRDEKRPRYDNDRPRDGDREDSYSRGRNDNQYPPREDYSRGRNDNQYPPREDYSRGRNDSQYPPREDRYSSNQSRPPYDDYERGKGRDYDRNASYESRVDDKAYEPRTPRQKKPFPSEVSPSKAIGIFGLSIHATENDLREFLLEELVGISDYKITVVHDRNTGRSKGYGFVYFQCLEDSIKAKERLVGKSIKGKEIRVDFSISDALRPSYR